MKHKAVRGAILRMLEMLTPPTPTTKAMAGNPNNPSAIPHVHANNADNLSSVGGCLIRTLRPGFTPLPVQSIPMPAGYAPSHLIILSFHWMEFLSAEKRPLLFLAER
jgi:hypothetical protein